MNPDLIFLGGTEFINTDRTYAYIDKFLPNIEVECESPDSRPLLGMMLDQTMGDVKESEISSPNLIHDGGFETSWYQNAWSDVADLTITTGNPASVEPTEGSQLLRVANDGSSSVSQALVFTPESRTADGPTHDRQFLTMDVSPGEVYRFEMNMVALGLGFEGELRLRANVGNTITNVDNYTFTATDQWERHALNVIIPDGVTSVTWILNTTIPAGDGFAADEVVVRNITEPAEARTRFRSPEEDRAPWYGNDNRSEDFYGFLPSGVTGLADSNRTSSVTELSTSGAARGRVRSASREVKFTGVLYAGTKEGLNFGLDWMISVLSGNFCPEPGVANCGGMELISYTLPDDLTPGSSAWGAYVQDNSRFIYDVGLLDGVKEKGRLLFSNAHAMEVEFVLSAGNAFIYTRSLYDVQVSNPSYEVVAEQTCGQYDAYASYVTDPQDGVVASPPKPPTISPLEMPSQWYRAKSFTSSSLLDVTNEKVFLVESHAPGEALRMLRVRFWDGDYTDECDYRGEFLIEYQPANTVLRMDGRHHTILLEQADGSVVPAGNLVRGSDGRPMTWPEYGCDAVLRVAVDYPSENLDIDVRVSTFGRR